MIRSRFFDLELLNLIKVEVYSDVGELHRTTHEPHLLPPVSWIKIDSMRLRRARVDYCTVRHLCMNAARNAPNSSFRVLVPLSPEVYKSLGGIIIPELHRAKLVVIKSLRHPRFHRIPWSFLVSVAVLRILTALASRSSYSIHSTNTTRAVQMRIFVPIDSIRPYFFSPSV